MESIKFGSVCSGIEAASAAWHPIGWSAAWLAEIEAGPSAVLSHHYPDVPNLGDMTKLADMVVNDSIKAPDVLVGGTPCQAFSVAGARKGLADDRGFLTIKFVELANAIDDRRATNGNEPAIIVWENVPGVLSSKDNAFGAFLGLLAGEDCELQPPGRKWSNAGYVRGPQRTIAWRILDAKYFGVAQRRRRVFVVASARKWFDPAAVLFESEGVRRDIAPSREAGKAVAALTANGVGTCGADDNQGQVGHLVPDVVGALTAKGPETNGAPEVDGNHVFAVLDASPTLQVEWRGFNFEQYSDGGVLSPTITATEYKGKTITYPCCTVVHGTQDPIVANDMAHCLGRNSGQENAVHYQMQVRRLTPTECERLQGFPDGYTLVPAGKKLLADGQRYKALGNSMAVPVMRWIGRRIQAELNKAAQ